MLDTRDALAHLDFTPPDAERPDGRSSRAANPATSGSKAGAEPGDKSADDSARQPMKLPSSALRGCQSTALELRDLRVARALDNGDRSAHETLTVADSFDDIREEMINNRVDTPELQTRLKDQIADPLRHISSQMFPAIAARLAQLRRVLDDPTAGPAKLEAAVKQADAILVEMKLVLDKMLELETFNEVVEMLRDIISSQEKLNQETLKRQKEDLKNKLRDLQE